MIIENISDYINALEKTSEHTIYRGQANKGWDLIPSIGRLHDKLENHNTLYKDWESLEKSLLSRFKTQSTPYMNFVPSSKIEWLIHAQHHGLPTPLLDWTTNPLVALYFSLCETDNDGFDGAVHTIVPKSWHSDSDDIDSIPHLIAFYPRHLNPRIVAQSGCFTVFPYPKKLVPMASLSDPNSYVSTEVYWGETIIIPKDSKPKLRKQLSRLGINHQTMFPGLDGIAKQILSEFSA
ncbi:FRG domain-containing protein [Shewanella aegiceratis]|uniref:FRG domain-containing protein n=1 Tax=Shewanella aegiceratis TaxID=2864203 RepID=UPI001C659E7D|nr:FRG domain-containing protein [Shewanella aegiceratis]QYJ81674.1 FRG domain-containing protein [Shewanella aegiceratis]